LSIPALGWTAAVDFGATSPASLLRSTGPSTTPQTLTLGVIGVPPQGTVHFECQLGQWIDDFNGGASASRLINVELR